MTFEDWWKLMKPAECDEMKEYFVECWNVAWEDAKYKPGKSTFVFGDGLVQIEILQKQLLIARKTIEQQQAQIKRLIEAKKHWRKK